MQKKVFETFKNDCFDREIFAQNIVDLIASQEEEQTRVIAIKANFGLGKTFFAKALQDLVVRQQEIRTQNKEKQQIYCHYIDIWNEDHNNQPLLALLLCIQEFMQKYSKLEGIRGCLKQVIGEVLTGEVSKPLNSKQSVLKEFNLLKQVVRDISKAFELLQNAKFAKMIIVIDEIDRCQSEYIIELLETLKQFFDIKNLYFILMLNDKYLQDKLRSKFEYIDFTYWKDKFINLEFKLPNVSQRNYAEYLLKKYDIHEKLESENIKLLFPHIGRLPTYEIRGIGRGYIINDKHLFVCRFIEHIANITFNNRQFDILYHRLSLVIKASHLETIYLDLALALILKDMLGDDFMPYVHQGTYYHDSHFEFTTIQEGKIIKHHTMELILRFDWDNIENYSDIMDNFFSTKISYIQKEVFNDSVKIENTLREEDIKSLQDNLEVIKFSVKH